MRRLLHVEEDVVYIIFEINFGTCSYIYIYIYSYFGKIVYFSALQFPFKTVNLQVHFCKLMIID